MRKSFLFGGLLLASCGCSSMNHAERGALGGGAVGALAGTVIGGMSGHPGAGAAIGAGAGALLGGAAGHDEDRHERRVAAAQARNQMALTDIVQLSQRRVPDNTIIHQIYSSGSVFNLTSQDLIYLHDQGVSDGVVSAMQNARGPVTINGRWVRPAGTVVYVDPPPPPPVSVGIGFGYGYGRRW